ncbi:MAG: thioredoxin family protein [Candidatus Dormiibacterota bacterium]
MEAQLLYFEGCPNWELARARLRAALDAVGSDAKLVLHQVTTAEEAARSGFRGSPTILLGGRDPFASPEDPIGLSCRLFQTPAGIAGAPTVEQLIAALTTAQRNPAPEG